MVAAGWPCALSCLRFSHCVLVIFPFGAVDAVELLPFSQLPPLFIPFPYPSVDIEMISLNSS